MKLLGYRFGECIFPDRLRKSEVQKVLPELKQFWKRTHQFVFNFFFPVQLSMTKVAINTTDLVTSHHPKCKLQFGIASNKSYTLYTGNRATWAVLLPSNTRHRVALQPKQWIISQARNTVRIVYFSAHERKKYLRFVWFKLWERKKFRALCLSYIFKNGWIWKETCPSMISEQHVQAKLSWL